MKQTIKYVRLDVHQATTVAVVREDSGRVIARSVLPTEAGGICEFVRGMRGAVQVASKSARRRSGCTTCWSRWSRVCWCVTGAASGAGGTKAIGMTPSS